MFFHVDTSVGSDRYCGFLDSFQPVYSWEKRKDDALMLLVRFASLGVLDARPFDFPSFPNTWGLHNFFFGGSGVVWDPDLLIFFWGGGEVEM